MKSIKPSKPDDTLRAAKRGLQERSRELVNSGVRSQESTFLIASPIAKAVKVRHRTSEF